MNELRYALRALKASPIVSIVAILSLALGIGANTAIFSLLDSLLLRSLPVHDPARLVVVGQTAESVGVWTNPIWEQMRARQHELFDGAAAWSGARFDLAMGGQTDPIDGVWVSGGFFDVLGVRPILGRTFTADDDRRGGGRDGAVAVISYSYWQRKYGGAPDAVGQTMTVSRVPYTIIGVAPPGFFGMDVGRTFDVALPFGTEPLMRGRESALDRRSQWWMQVAARLKAGQSFESAQAALRGVQSQIREATLPENWRKEDLAQYLTDPMFILPAATGTSGLRQRYQRPLTTIMVVVGLVLLVACANIANLLLARATARRHEMSVRLALGAPRRWIVRQLLVESLVLSGLGAALGLLFAQWGSRLLVRLLSTQASTVFLDVDLDWRVLAFTAAVAVVTAVLFGTAPAVRATRVDPMDAIREHGRGFIGERRFGLANALVIVQVALSLVLVIGAGLFVRTFASLATRDLGFHRDPVLVVNVNAARSGVEPAQRLALFERLHASVLPVPGVGGAALSVVTPMSNSRWNYLISLPGSADRPERDRIVHVNFLSPGWFSAYGTPILSGRDFEGRDTLAAPRVAIVNEAFVRKYFSGEMPIGRTIVREGGPTKEPPAEIVGVVRDAVYSSLRDPPPPTFYLPLAQSSEPPSSVSLSVRAAAGSPAVLMRPVVAAVMEVNGGLSLTVRQLAEQVNAALVQERLVAMLSGFFGALALLMAALGLYGVTAYTVSRRRTEIGIRMALGSAPARVVRLVLTRVAILVTLGVAAGAAVALWAGRFVGTLLYGLEPRDPWTLAAGVLVLLSVGALAGWVPAWRASRVDPAQVLRE